MKRILSLYLFILLLFPSSAFALSIYPPPTPIVETAQRAVIWYENGIETLIISTTFKGTTAKDFGWLIPVPSKPEVDTASDELYTALEDLTRPKYRVDRGPLEIPFGISGLREKQLAPPPPTIIQTKEVDVFDITTLEAKDKEGLTKWLSDNGYPYPADRDHIIKSYIEQNWYFVAVKVNSGALGFAQKALRDGHATPLKIAFPTDKIIYPLRLSGPGIPTSQAGAIVAAFSFEQGTEGFFGTYTPISSTDVIFAETQPDTSRSLPKVDLRLDQNDAYHGRFSIKINATNTQPNQTIIAQRSISNLTAGKTYTISAWAKSDIPKNGSAFISLSGQTSEQSNRIALSNLSDWKLLSLTFVAPASFVSLNLNTSNSSAGETINWDAVQIEEGDKATDFKGEILPTGMRGIDQQRIDQVTLLLYVFANHKKELPGFTTTYASWVSEKTIEKLAFTPDGTKPWIEAKGRMYLTKLHRQAKPTEMTTDLILRDAENNDPVNAESFPEVSTIRFFVVVILVLILEIGAIVGFVIYKRKKSNVSASS